MVLMRNFFAAIFIVFSLQFSSALAFAPETIELESIDGEYVEVALNEVYGKFYESRLLKVLGIEAYKVAYSNGVLEIDSPYIIIGEKKLNIQAGTEGG